MDNLALEIFDRTGTGSQFAFLDDGTEITIIDTSEIFASGDIWTHDFTLNVHANAHIFGTAGDIHGAQLHDQIHQRRARLWVEGVPLYFGYLAAGDEVDVDEDGNVDVHLESGRKSFDQMIEGAQANQVPLLSDVPFGMALCRERVILDRMIFWGDAAFSETPYNQSPFPIVAEMQSNAYLGDFLQRYPRTVLNKGVFKDVNSPQSEGEPYDFTNSDSPYTEDENGTPTHPYCNTTICYQKHVYDKDGNSEEQRGYDVSAPKDGINSAPNFFVLYWLRALMTHLGINIEENQMMDVEDLRRLFMVNTNCAYKERTYNGDPSVDTIGLYSGARAISEGDMISDMGESHLDVVAEVGEPIVDSPYQEDVAPSVENLSFALSSVTSSYELLTGYLYHKAFATSYCFPNVSVADIIEMLENSFGVRFLFDREYRRVRIVLLRNIFRDMEVQTVVADTISVTKQENNIDGFRMTYGVTDNTAFFYKGFNDMLPHKKELWPEPKDTHDYSSWNLNAQYGNIIHQVTAFNKTCYVTPNNGNAYGVKVDKDAKRYNDKYPSLFEFAGYMDAEDGDCSGEEETIKEVHVGFTPAIMNDVNMENERNTGTQNQQFAMFVDETMKPRFGSFSILSDTYCDFEHNDALTSLFERSDATGTHICKVTWPLTMHIKGHVHEGYNLFLYNNFEPNDDGICPIETHDWGLTLGIMRYSGPDALVYSNLDIYDEQLANNRYWELRPGGSATSHPDTCNDYGQEWTYATTVVVRSAADATAALSSVFPNSNAAFHTQEMGYINGVGYYIVCDNEGLKLKVLVATQYSISGALYNDFAWMTACREMSGHSVEEMMAMDAAGIVVGYMHGNPDEPIIVQNILVEIGSSEERGNTLKDLCAKAYGSYNSIIYLDNGIGSRYGRFSLKLRAEKPNPKFDPTQPETKYDPEHPEMNTNPRYLTINDPNLRGRGLMDQFHKEESYWWRNARVAKMTVQLELAQFLSIDKTKRVKVVDITGFIKKREFKVSKKKGLGPVTMEIMYI